MSSAIKGWLKRTSTPDKPGRGRQGATGKSKNTVPQRVTAQYPEAHQGAPEASKSALRGVWQDPRTKELYNVYKVGVSKSSPQLQGPLTVSLAKGADQPHCSIAHQGATKPELNSTNATSTMAEEEFRKRYDAAVKLVNAKARQLDLTSRTDDWQGVEYDLGRMRKLYLEALEIGQDRQAVLADLKDTEGEEKLESELNTLYGIYSRSKGIVEDEIFSRFASKTLDDLVKQAEEAIMGCMSRPLEIATFDGCDDKADALQYDVNRILDELKPWEGKISPDKIAHYKKLANDMSSRVVSLVPVWKEAIRHAHMTTSFMGLTLQEQLGDDVTSFPQRDTQPPPLNLRSTPISAQPPPTRSLVQRNTQPLTSLGGATGPPEGAGKEGQGAGGARTEDPNESQDQGHLQQTQMGGPIESGARPRGPLFPQVPRPPLGSMEHDRVRMAAGPHHPQRLHPSGTNPSQPQGAGGLGGNQPPSGAQAGGNPPPWAAPPPPWQNPWPAFTPPQGWQGMNQPAWSYQQGPPRPKLKVKAHELPKFNGIPRDYQNWKEDWARMQSLSDDSGHDDTVKKLQLTQCLSEKVQKKIPGINRCRTYGEIMELLDSEYGDVAKLTHQIIDELQRFPTAGGLSPRRMLDLIHVIEESVKDIQQLGDPHALNNAVTVRAIEQKLPDRMLHDWCKYWNQSRAAEQDRFTHLRYFLAEQKEVLKMRERLQDEAPAGRPREDKRDERGRGNRGRGEKKAYAHATTKETSLPACAMCGAQEHGLFSCKEFLKLNQVEKGAFVKKAKVCNQCLRPHVADLKCDRNYTCPCGCGVNFRLCLKYVDKKAGKGGKGKPERREKKKPLTRSMEQEEFWAKLQEANDPALVASFKKAYANATKVAKCSGTKGANQQKKEEEQAVLLLLQNIQSNTGEVIGTMIDTAADSNFVTHEFARRLQLEGEEVDLAVSGVDSMVKRKASKKYILRVRKKDEKGQERVHVLFCYGLDEIAEVNKVPTPESIQKIFPTETIEELTRPRQIDLLIGICEANLLPQIKKITGNLVLFEGPLGKVIGGSHPNIIEQVIKTAQESTVHYIRSMKTAAITYTETAATTGREIYDLFSWSSIGAPCEPRCGGCKCGSCPPGGKEMTLAEEREMEMIRENLTFVQSDEHSNQPHWDTAYPYKINPESLPDNKRGAMATFLRTEKRLEKEPAEWRETYKAQVRDMVERGAAIKLSDKQLAGWDGAVWYICSLAAVNPNSTTTPVRIVWNSSQEFKGISLNDILHKGPDVLNPIRGVLLRFRAGVHAALGDIRKMYNSVWLKEQEVHLHRFLWRYNIEDEIDTYAVVRVNMGDKPSASIAQIAMRETARLPQFSHMTEERRVVEEDSYVDDIMTSHNDKEKLTEITTGVSNLLKGGNFHVKAWVVSGQKGETTSTTDTKQPAKPKTILLPNQMQEEENKALGMGYDVESDELSMMTSVNFSKRKGKMRTGINLREDEIRESTPTALTRRMLLSQQAALYDPAGLAAPAKQKGAILVRKAFQEAGGGSMTKETWDAPLSQELREESINLFEEYARLGQIRFKRGLTPAGWKGSPWGITFSDGSEKSYGAVLYLRWETNEGVEVRLVEAKAKLTPLDQKGDVIKAEICGAVFASRLKMYFGKHCRIPVERWIHIVDSQTVLGAIQRDSYGYQTFFANRVGEIQKAGPASDWRWVAGELNVADLATRGATPEELDENSTWQRGPEFLREPEDQWPVKTAGEVAASVAGDVKKLQRKAFAAVTTRARKKALDKETTDPKDANTLPQPTVSAKDGATSPTLPQPQGNNSTAAQVLEKPNHKWGAALTKLVKPERYSDLTRLCKVVAWVRRAAEKWLSLRGKKPKTEGNSKREAGRPTKIPVLTVKERKKAFQDLAQATQEGEDFHLTTLNRLVTYKDEETGLVLCRGRVQTGQEDGNTVPLIPAKSWLGTLLAREAHQRNHEGVATTLLRMRQKAWVVQGRLAAKKVINDCVTCRKHQAKLSEQAMGFLPPERTNPAEPFEYTTLDLFGPFDVKDMVKKRTKMKVWGLVFCCMASRAMYADVVSDQSTESFLKAYTRFAALKGHPRKLWSDNGTNFVGAQPALHELHKQLKSLDKTAIEDAAAKEGTEWKWEFHPADSPHRNGAAEAAVKIIKRALANLREVASALTWEEFQTLLFAAANLANERPIDARAQLQEDTVEYVSPNSLILGRTSQGGDTKGIEMKNYSWKRLEAIQTGVDKFWSRWCALAGPNLFIRPRWHTRERDVSEGDLVWIADQNALRGQFRLGRVVAIRHGEDGAVRTVDVKTCIGLPATTSPRQRGRQPPQPTLIPTIILRRDVRRLVVLLPAEEQGGDGASRKTPEDNENVLLAPNETGVE